VAAPGGRVATLEITAPRGRLLRALFFGVFGRMPGLLARLLGADPAAYAYLPESVRRYPDAETVAGIMRAAGLREVRIVPLLGGIVVLHVGVK
jgi:ubiquinone/menaquinone biosynthesis C-methylase UbiE